MVFLLNILYFLPFLERKIFGVTRSKRRNIAEFNLMDKEKIGRNKLSMNGTTFNVFLPASEKEDQELCVGLNTGISCAT